MSLQVKKNTPGSNDLFVLLDFMSAFHSPNKDVLLENKLSCILVIGSIAEGEKQEKSPLSFSCSLCSARVTGRTNISLQVKEEGINVKISVGGEKTFHCSQCPKILKAVHSFWDVKLVPC